MGGPQSNNSQMMGSLPAGLAGGGGSGGDPMMAIQGLGLGLPQYRNMQQQQQQQQQHYYVGAPNVGLVGQVAAPMGLYPDIYSSGTSGIPRPPSCLLYVNYSPPRFPAEVPPAPLCRPLPRVPLYFGSCLMYLRPPTHHRGWWIGG